MRGLNYSHAMYADTYALLAYKNGKTADALRYQQISCDQYDFSDQDMNERYCVYYEAINSPKDATAIS